MGNSVENLTLVLRLKTDKDLDFQLVRCRLPTFVECFLFGTAPKRTVGLADIFF
jgi:hypothetical protein